MHRRILQLAIPSIISNITVPLLGLVDVAITGHMELARWYVAAIAVGSMAFNIMYWLLSFLRFGTGGMTAQAYGARDNGLCARLLVRALTVATAIALVLVALQVPLCRLIVWIIAPDPFLVGLVEKYFLICIWGTIPSLGLYALTGWFVGMQNTRLPMAVSVIQNVINICLSYVLVFYAHLSVTGIALGTMIAQWTGFVMALMAVAWRYADVFRGAQGLFQSTVADYRHFFMVNGPLFVRTVFLVAVNVWIIVAGAKGGVVILAVNSIIMQMFILYTYIMDGFAFAAEALCGRYYGARDGENFRRALRGVWQWALGLVAVYTLAYIFGSSLFTQMLTTDSVVREAAKDYYIWAILIPVSGVAAFVWDGVFVGITNTVGMLKGTMGGAISFFLVYALLAGSMGNHALWLAFDVYLLMRGVVQHAIFHTMKSRGTREGIWG